jgi:hypothetical protein
MKFVGVDDARTMKIEHADDDPKGIYKIAAIGRFF